jgi:DNA invertase Pin-like site-specific DNA recombinase
MGQPLTYKELETIAVLTEEQPRAHGLLISSFACHPRLSSAHVAYHDGLLTLRCSACHCSEKTILVSGPRRLGGFAMVNAKSGDKNRAIGYVRAPKDALEDRRKALAEFAASKRIVVVDWFVDVGGSENVSKRPGIVAAISALRIANAGVLLVEKRDRLAKDPIVAGALEALALDRGARVLSAFGEDLDLDGVLVRDVHAEVVKIERSKDSAIRSERARRAKRMGPPPYGFRIAEDGGLEKDPREWKALEFMRAQRTKGETLDAICDACTKRGWLTRKGTKFSRSQVLKLVEREGKKSRTGHIMSTPGDAKKPGKGAPARSEATTNAA